MEFVADIFLGTGALAAALYCLILSRKLTRLKGLDQDLGGAISQLSAQVDDMNRALRSAQDAATLSSTKLDEQTKQAESVADKLEILMAALHDITDDPAPVAASAPPAPPVPPAPAPAAPSVASTPAGPAPAAPEPAPATPVETHQPLAPAAAPAPEPELVLPVEDDPSVSVFMRNPKRPAEVDA